MAGPQMSRECMGRPYFIFSSQGKSCNHNEVCEFMRPPVLCTYSDVSVATQGAAFCLG